MGIPLRFETLFGQRSPADLQGVAVRASSYAQSRSIEWNWQLSGHFRMASLASAWALILLSGALGPLLFPIAAVRFCFSTAQTGLNIRLGRRQPVGKQDRLDIALIVLIFVGAYTAVGIGHVTGSMMSPMALFPMLVPFSVLQVRMTLRSYRAHAAMAGAKEPRVIPFPGRQAPEPIPFPAPSPRQAA